MATRSSEPEKAKVAAAVAESMVAARGVRGGRWVLREKAPRSGESGPCVRLLDQGEQVTMSAWFEHEPDLNSVQL